MLRYVRRSSVARSCASSRCSAGRHVPPRRPHPHQGVGADGTRHARARETFAKLGVGVSERQSTSRRLPPEGRRRQADDRRRPSLQGLRRRAGARHWAFTSTDHDRRRGRARTSRSRARSSRLAVPLRPRFLGSTRSGASKLDRPARPDRGAAPPRRARRRDHRVSEFASIFERLRQRGDYPRDARRR